MILVDVEKMWIWVWISSAETEDATERNINDFVGCNNSLSR